MTQCTEAVRSLALCVLLASPLRAQEPVPAPEPKNAPPVSVLFIVTDQHHASALGAAGNADIRTPHLDRLAHEGVIFDRAFCNTPQCRPSRYTMWTGEYARTHGLAPERTTVAELLQEAGYRTASIGKHHMRRERMGRRHGFDETVDMREYARNLTELEEEAESTYDAFTRARKDDVLARALEDPEPTHPTTFWTDETVRRLRSVEDQPFFLWVSYYGPHHPYTPSANWLERYTAEDLQLPTSHASEVDPDIPVPVRREKHAFTPEHTREVLAHYYAWISQIDAGIGRLLETLDELGLAERTLVVFTSDHGDMAARHRMWTKGQLGYDDTLRVPLILRLPGVLPSGRREAGLVGLVDLMPTILELTGVPPAGALPGRSLLPLLRDGSTPWRETLFAELGEASGEHVLVAREADTKYVAYRSGREVTHEQLFDLRGDPDELVNLAGRPEQSATLERLRDALARWEAETPTAE